jgi:hypothetical protein
MDFGFSYQGCNNTIIAAIKPGPDVLREQAQTNKEKDDEN